MDALVENDSVVLDKKQKFTNGHQTKPLYWAFSSNEPIKIWDYSGIWFTGHRFYDYHCVHIHKIINTTNVHIEESSPYHWNN